MSFTRFSRASEHGKVLLKWSLILLACTGIMIAAAFLLISKIPTLADQLPAFVGDKESWLHYQLIANNQDGLITSSEVYFNVTVKGCEP